MLAIGDPAIKLFGKTIPVVCSSELRVVPVKDVGIAAGGWGINAERGEDDEQAEKVKTEQEKSMVEMSQNDQSSPESGDRNPSTESNEDEKATGDGGTEEKESGETNELQEKGGSLKKPDKLLPCPRCNSMDTKFCYYNNYNVNQPRHFCKSCQRYWTAGGVMRNVPVGSGRRKNKTCATTYSRHSQFAVSSKALLAAQDAAAVVAALNTANGVVLTFGADNPLPNEPVPSIVFNRHDHDHSSGGSSTVTTTSSSMDHQTIRSKPPQYPIADHSMNGCTTNPIPCFPVGVQWPYAVPLPAYYPPTIPIPLYPAPNYNGIALWRPPTAVLGKHPREVEGEGEGEGETIKRPRDDTGSICKPPAVVLVPKTLRIVDPDEAAKSSIWTTLGIKKAKVDHDATSKGGGGCFFRGFGSKTRVGKPDDPEAENCQVLKANPIAMCRSISFQETA